MVDGVGQALVAEAVVLFPEDTVSGALRLMREHGVHLLPVVDGKRGDLLGNVTAEELLTSWKHVSQCSMAEVLAGREAEKITGRMALRFTDGTGRWLH